MASINLFLTNYCNLGCRHCVHESSKTQKDSHMSLKEVQFAINFIHNSFLKITEEQLAFLDEQPIRVVGLSGGEPLCHPNFWNIVRTFTRLKRDFRFNLELHTNATIRIKPQIFDSYRELHFDKIIVSTNKFTAEKRNLKEQNLASLTQFGEVCMQNIARPPNYELIRIKGAAIKLNKDNFSHCSRYCFREHINQEVQYTSSPIQINFWPGGRISFCCENKDPSLYQEYDKQWLEDPLSFWMLAKDITQNSLVDKCSDPCQIGLYNFKKESENE